MLARPLIFIIAACAGAASAQPLIFDDGHGREWRQLTDTTNLSWNQIAQVCPPDGGGPCAGTLATVDVGGWHWATQPEVQQLFSLMVPEILQTPSLAGPQYMASALFFLNDWFRPTFQFYTTFGGYLYLAGWTSTSTPDGTAIVASVSSEYPVFYGHWSVIGQEMPDTPLRYAGVWLWRSTGCPADLSGSSDPNDPAYGIPDGSADASDFFYFLDQFAAGNLPVADLSGSSDPNDPAYGTPDGTLDASDFFFYLDQFVSGCP